MGLTVEESNIIDLDGDCELTVHLDSKLGTCGDGDNYDDIEWNEKWS